MWLGYRGMFADTDALQCYDFWEMRSGYHVTVTNRLEELPRGFSLHPTEVCDSFAYKLLVQFDKGEYPEEPVDGPNLWRLKSGRSLGLGWGGSP